VKRKVILTCAVTGDGPIHPKYPDYPVTPRQIADACADASSAGASAVHIHARDPMTGAGSRDPELFKEIVDRVRDSDEDPVINFSAGVGATYVPDPENESVGLSNSDMAPADVRLEHVAAHRPDICSLDVTTFNMEGGIAGAESCVYMNTTRTLRSMANTIRELGVRPEIEVFSPGDILLAKQMIGEGLLAQPPLFQICLGVKWAAPADVDTLIYMRNLLPEAAHWACFGISRHQMPFVGLSTILGGHCRVGLEDNVYLERGVFATNGQLVERARTIIESLGASVATPAEAREIYGLRSNRLKVERRGMR
jgi:uncharacterized protein (DUF849 family)